MRLRAIWICEWEEDPFDIDILDPDQIAATAQERAEGDPAELMETASHVDFRVEVVA